MLIGLISDTHDFLDPRVPSIFKGVEHILHGGDIGRTSIIMALERIAPVTAVLGNTDSGIDVRETEVVELAGRKFLLHHIVDVRDPGESIQRRIEKEAPDVVIFGHTHKPHDETIGATRYVNPGYAGKPRFNLPRSVALLHCGPDGVRVEFKAIG
jgi:putative phosphoesterase